MCVRRFIRAAGISECSAAAALSGIVSAMADLPLVDVATGLDGRHGACRRHRFFSPSSQRLLLAVCERSAACLRAAVYRAGGQLRDRAARGAVARGGRAGRGGAHGCVGREDGCAATLWRFKASALTRVRALTRRMRLKAFFVWYVVVGGVVRSNAIP